MARRVEHKSPDGSESYVEYVFTPSKPLKGFTHYSLDFTPKSKLICVVAASADYPLLDTTPSKLDWDLSQALKEKYGEPKEEIVSMGGGRDLKTSVYTKGSLWIQFQHPLADDVPIARLAGSEPRVRISLSYGDSEMVKSREKEAALDQQVEKIKKQL